MAQTAHLYLKTSQGVRGPFSAYRLHEMVRRGRISSQSEVSPDGVRWLSAGRIRGLFSPVTREEPVATREGVVPVPAVRPEVKRIAAAVDKAVRPVRRYFRWTVAAAGLGALVGSLLIFQLGTRFLAPEAASIVVFGLALLPAALVGAAFGQLAGNLLIRALTRISDPERRCLALHVPWSRAPGRWPTCLRNWIYGGDWLRTTERDILLPYVRAFVTGEAPRTIEEELALWSELLAQTANRNVNGLEVGHAVRDLASLERLPDWTREVDPGTTLPKLVQRLGQVGRDWAICLFRRAVNRMPELAEADKTMDQVLFEFHYCMLSREREALVVVLRPKPNPPKSDRHPAAEAA